MRSWFDAEQFYNQFDCPERTDIFAEFWFHKRDKQFSCGMTCMKRGGRNANVTCNLDTKRLGCVEPSATNEERRHTKRVEHVGKMVFCGKAKRSKKGQGEPEAENKGWRMKHPTAKLM